MKTDLELLEQNVKARNEYRLAKYMWKILAELKENNIFEAKHQIHEGVTTYSAFCKPGLSLQVYSKNLIKRTPLNVKKFEDPKSLNNEDFLEWAKAKMYFDHARILYSMTDFIQNILDFYPSLLQQGMLLSIPLQLEDMTTWGKVEELEIVTYKIEKIRFSFVNDDKILTLYIS